VRDRAGGDRRPPSLLRPVLEPCARGVQGRRRAADEGGPMSTPTQDTSVRVEVVVEAPVERAFSVFTEGFGRFKPREHNLLGGEAIAETVFEPRVGGRVNDGGVEGGEGGGARVLVYERPSRVVFSWDISPQWQLEHDPERTSEVEVRFIAETPERTRVELEHRHLERHGAGWEGVREGVGGKDGWPRYRRGGGGPVTAGGGQREWGGVRLAPRVPGHAQRGRAQGRGLPRGRT